MRAVVRRATAYFVTLQRQRFQAWQERQGTKILGPTHEIVRQGETGDASVGLETIKAAQAVVAEEEVGCSRRHFGGYALDGGDVLAYLWSQEIPFRCGNIRCRRLMPVSQKW